MVPRELSKKQPRYKFYLHFKPRTVTESRWSESYIHIGVSNAFRNYLKSVKPEKSHGSSYSVIGTLSSNICPAMLILVFCRCSPKSSKTVVKPSANISNGARGQVLGLVLQNIVIYKVFSTCAVFWCSFSLQLENLLEVLRFFLKPRRLRPSVTIPLLLRQLTKLSEISCWHQSGPTAEL